MDGVLFYVAFAFLVFGLPLIVVYGVPFVVVITRLKSRDRKPGDGTAEGKPWQAAADRTPTHGRSCQPPSLAEKGECEMEAPASQSALRELRALLEEAESPNREDWQLNGVAAEIARRMPDAQKELVELGPQALNNKTLVEARETLDALAERDRHETFYLKHLWRTWPDPFDVVRLADAAGIRTTEAWKLLGGGSEPLDEALAQTLAGDFDALAGVSSLYDHIRSLHGRVLDKWGELQSLKSDAKVYLAVMAVGVLGVLIAIVSGVRFLGGLSGVAAFIAWGQLLFLVCERSRC